MNQRRLQAIRPRTWYSIGVKAFVIIALLSTLLTSLFYARVLYDAPKNLSGNIQEEKLVKVSSDHFVLGNSWLRKNERGNWECYVEGSSYERGVTLGILQKELIEKQEEVFIAEIEKYIPSPFMQRFLLTGIAWFNRDLDKSIPPEFLEEIYGVSEYFSSKYDWVGPRFNRILNYHAAHDIGHAVQNMHLVACTAFGTKTIGSNYDLILGRNFDFYFGDEFAKNKIILFCNPDNGYDFASVTWAGFCGVVSGMNEKGLSVTLNSDKSEIPRSAGTPVSIIAREILQYASSFEQAIEICKNHQSFVSESFTICSAIDSGMMVIEKTPDTLAVYYPDATNMVVSNHFQSKELKDLEINLEHLAESESKYRFDRTIELLDQYENPTPEDIVNVLRDRRGLGNKDIGMGNPMVINQLLAHHAVIFKPYQKLIWVSNYPFQEGAFDAYSLSKMEKFSGKNLVYPVSIDTLQISEDPFLHSKDYESFKLYKTLYAKVKEAGENKIRIENEVLERFANSNPEYYESYRLCAWYYDEMKDYPLAINYYTKALTKEIPFRTDRIAIENRLEEISLK